MRTRLILVALVATLLPAVAHADVAYTRYDAMVPMSDGVKIDASLYVPDAADGVPMIVRSHGGGSNKDSEYDIHYGLKAVTTGRFALLSYSARGHGNSEGLFDFFGPTTVSDFSEMLDWVAATHAEIDTGNVGVVGISQGGGVSLLGASADPRVKAVAVGNTFADLNHALNPNDCFKSSFAMGIFAAAYKSSASRTRDDLAVRWGATWNSDTEDLSTPLVPSTTEEVRAHSPLTYIQPLIDRKMPVFWMQSFEDQLFPGDHPDMMLKPLEAAGAPVHRWYSSGGHSAGPDWLPDQIAKEAAIVDWFDQHLLGIDHGFGTSRPSTDYWRRTGRERLGAGSWEHLTTHGPLPVGGGATLFAHADGSLASTPGATEVGTVINTASLNLANDPIASGEVAGRAPGLEQVAWSVPEQVVPADTVSFSTTTTISVDVAGTPVVDVPFETTAKRVVQLSAKLWDGDRMVTRGCVSLEGEELASGHATIKLWPTAWRFGVGHGLRLTVSATDFPTFKPETEPSVTTLGSGTTITLT